MSDDNDNNVQVAEELSDEKRLFRLCKSPSISKDALLEIIQRLERGSSINNYFFLAACKNESTNEDIIKLLLEYFPEAVNDADHGWTALHCACLNKNATLKMVNLLVDASPSLVRRINSRGQVPVHSLCVTNDWGDERNAIEILQLLSEKCPESIRHADNDGRLPIHIASIKRSLKFCQIMIESYPNSVRSFSGNGYLPIHLACIFNTLPLVKYLYKLYPDAVDKAANEKHPILNAIRHTRNREDSIDGVKIVKYLLNCIKREPIDSFFALRLFGVQKYKGVSLLRFACKLTYNDSNIEAGMEIIKAIYDVEPEAIYDDVLLRPHMHSFHPRVHMFLNEEGECAERARDHDWISSPLEGDELPLHYAVRENFKLGSVKLFVMGYPAAIEHPDNFGTLPLHLACLHHDTPDVVRYLIDLDTALLDEVDMDGNTPLHCACFGAKYNTILMLLKEYDAVAVSKRNLSRSKYQLPFEELMILLNDNDAVAVSKRDLSLTKYKLPFEELIESDAVLDRESAEYIGCVFQLLRAYPETLRALGCDERARETYNG